MCVHTFLGILFRSTSLIFYIIIIISVLYVCVNVLYYTLFNKYNTQVKCSFTKQMD